MADAGVMDRIMTGTGGSLRFLGAADTVTGSRFLVERAGRRVLVDCGLFQGFKVLRARNRAPFPIDPSSIDAVILTHAHLDHSGYLPALVRDGFDGPIFASEGTAELCGILLPDSAHLLEEEARAAARGGWSRHEHPRPLYDTHDVERAMHLLDPVAFHEPQRIGDEFEFSLIRAGHILGAAGVALRLGDRVVRFTGDLGRPDDPLMPPPEELGTCDILVTESTYGDHSHGLADPQVVLGEIVRRVAAAGGVVLIPAFAVGRTETILLHLSRLRAAGDIPDIPIFVNSPMAVSVVDVYRRHAAEHRIDQAELDRMYDLATMIRSVDDSKLLNLRGGPMIIISASGMLTGGRVLHHLVAYGPDPKNAIVLTGFQAGGTRGAALLAGADTLRIFGKDVAVRAEVHHLHTMSAHADARQTIDWMRTGSRPSMVYVTHGEPAAADALRLRIERELHWAARVPEHGEKVTI